MAFEDFYSHYPKKVAKGDAIKAWDKLKPDKDLEKQMILALDAQKRYRKEAQNSGQFIPEWCGPAVWIRQQRWLDEIPSHSKLKEKVDAKQCQCGKPVHGPRFSHCQDCLVDEWSPIRRAHAEQVGLTRNAGETREEWLIRMREAAKHAADRLGVDI